MIAEHLTPAEHQTVVARFDAVAQAMPRIAEVVNVFTDPALREKAYYELVSIINPDAEPVDPSVGPLAKILSVEGLDGETPTETTLRLLKELRRRRAHPAGFTRESAEPADGATLADGNDVWVRRRNEGVADGDVLRLVEVAREGD